MPRKRRPSELLGPGEYEWFYAQQNGCCAICGRDAATLTRRLDVDHDHRPPRNIRGLLCSPCNRSLPSERNLPAGTSLSVWLWNALQYVSEYETVTP